MLPRFRSKPLYGTFFEHTTRYSCFDLI
jgi:hypothetical protein